MGEVWGVMSKFCAPHHVQLFCLAVFIALHLFCIASFLHRSVSPASHGSPPGIMEMPSLGGVTQILCTAAQVPHFLNNLIVVRFFDRRQRL